MAAGEKIRDARKAQKMSQDDLANLLGVTRGAVSQWESGGGIWHYRIPALCLLLRMPLHDFFDGLPEDIITESALVLHFRSVPPGAREAFLSAVREIAAAFQASKPSPKPPGRRRRGDAGDDATSVAGRDR